MPVRNSAGQRGMPVRNSSSARGEMLLRNWPTRGNAVEKIDSAEGILLKTDTPRQGTGWTSGFSVRNPKNRPSPTAHCTPPCRPCSGCQRPLGFCPTARHGHAVAQLKHRAHDGVPRVGSARWECLAVAQMLVSVGAPRRPCDGAAGASACMGDGPTDAARSRRHASARDPHAPLAGARGPRHPASAFRRAHRRDIRAALASRRRRPAPRRHRPRPDDRARATTA